MIYEAFHRLVFPAVVVSVVGSVWITAWSHAVIAEASKGSWPALPVPDRVLRIEQEEAAKDLSPKTASPKDPSLHKVFLEHDQVVGVR
jgi:hypothetical protein